MTWKTGHTPEKCWEINITKDAVHPVTGESGRRAPDRQGSSLFIFLDIENVPSLKPFPIIFYIDIFVFI